MSDNIKVIIRSRPFVNNEKDNLWNIEDNVIWKKSDSKASFQFDKVYSHVTNTEIIYKENVLSIVKSAISGINGTVFAYGQTGSGKTFTMTGDENNEGIIQMGVSDIFTQINLSLDREFLVRISYIEIYQENVVDLLAENPKYLAIKEIKNCVYVSELSENVATCINDVMSIMFKGLDNRHVAETKMNDKSSRSHSIFRIVIESKLKKDTDSKSVMVSQLNFVDLAGSENAKQSQAHGQRLAEGGSINKSLLSLSNVIESLSQNQKFINYRNSKLTRILKNSLGGNSKTSIICAISPISINQTISTLRFAMNAKKIKNKPIVNEIISGETMLRKYRNQIKELEKQLAHERGQSAMENREKIEILMKQICTNTKKEVSRDRRLTWAFGSHNMPPVSNNPDNLNFSRVPDNFIKKQKFNPDMSIIMSDDLYQDEEAFTDSDSLFSLDISRDKTKKDLSSSILGFNVFKKSNLSMTEPRHNKTLENATPREDKSLTKELKIDLNGKTQTISELRDYINILLKKELDATTELAMSQEVIAEMKTKYAAMEEESSKVSNDFTAKIRTVEDECSNLNAELKKVNACQDEKIEIESLQTKLSKMNLTTIEKEKTIKEQSTEMCSSLLKKDKDIEVLTREISKMKTTMSEKNTIINSYKAKFEMEQLTNKDSMLCVNDINEVLGTENEDLLEKISFMKEQHDTMINETGESKKEFQNIIAQLHEKLETMKINVSTLEDEKDSLEDKIENIMEKGLLKIKKLNEEISELENNNEDIEKSLQMLKASNDITEERLYEEHSLKVTCLNENIELLKNENESLIDEIGDLKGKINTTSRMAFLESKVEKLKFELEEMQDQRNIARIKLLKNENNFRIEMREKKEKLEFLEKKIPILIKDNHALKMEIRQLKNTDLGESFMVDTLKTEELNKPHHFEGALAFLNK